MKQLLDFLPLVVFFIFYKLYDIFVASGALVVATGLALVASWVLYRKLEKMTIFTFVLVAVFGTLTLVFHNDEFIKWKVTVIYSLFALALLFSQWFMKQPLIQTMLGKRAGVTQHCMAQSEYCLGPLLFIVWSGEYLCGILVTSVSLG